MTVTPVSSRQPDHHLHPRANGGPTSLANLRLFCWVHHHVFIHRLGWAITAHPDGALTATSPQGKVIRSHGPRDPGPRSGPGGEGPPGTTGPPESPGEPGGTGPPESTAA
jgi:hypothetical protein